MLEIKRTQNFDEIHDLYVSSFPEEERMELEDLYAPHMESELLSIYLDKEFVGFFSLFSYQHLTSILYFAIRKEFQDRGVGSQAIQWLQKYKDQQCIFADLELPTQDCDNFNQREARIRFYEKNGFQKTAIQYTWKRESYCIYSWDTQVSKEEFGNFWKHFGMKRNDKVIQKTKEYVQDLFKNEYSGHDYFHTERVYKLATKLAKEEECDVFIVQLAALLHDVDDYKLSKETYKNKDRALQHLNKMGMPEDIIDRVVHIIDEISFKGTDSQIPDSIEGMCVQDADRLDAIGAIGIARCFTFGGYHQRILYDPAIQPNLGMDEKTYRNHVSTTFNHFYEKLFLLEKMMNTKSAKKMAEHRQKIMEDYIEEFLLEWDGKK